MGSVKEEDVVVKEEAETWDPSAWDLASLKRYLFYVCPQCDYMEKDVRLFQNHFLKHYVSNNDDDVDDDLIEDTEEIMTPQSIDLPAGKDDKMLIEHDVTKDVSVDSMLKESRFFQPSKLGKDNEEDDRPKFERLQCYRCGEDVTGAPAVADEHRQRYHGFLSTILVGLPRRIQCVDCGATFPDVDKFKNHHKSSKRHVNVNFQCNDCGNGYRFKRTFLWHMKKKTTDGGQCPTNTKTVKRIEANIVKKKKKKLTTCEGCGKVFKKHSEMMRHYKVVHAQEKPHICDQCGNRYATMSQLRSHLDNVHSGNKYPCEQCGNHYSKGAISKHIRAVHGEKRQESITCGMCNRKYLSSSSFSLHKRKCIQDKGQFKCEYCPQVFKTHAPLVPHVRFHLNQFDKTSKQRSKKSCTYCGMSFHTQSFLDLHLATCQPNPIDLQPSTYQDHSLLTNYGPGSSWM